MAGLMLGNYQVTAAPATPAPAAAQPTTTAPAAMMGHHTVTSAPPTTSAPLMMGNHIVSTPLATTAPPMLGHHAVTAPTVPVALVAPNPTPAAPAARFHPVAPSTPIRSITTHIFAPVKAPGQFQLYDPQNRQAPTITLFRPTPPPQTHYMGKDWATGYKPDRSFDNLYVTPLSPSLIRRNLPKKTSPETYFLSHEYVSSLAVPPIDQNPTPAAAPRLSPVRVAWLIPLLEWILALVLFLFEYVFKSLFLALSLIGSIIKAVFGFLAMVVTKENVGVVCAAVFVVYKVLPKPWGAVRTLVEVKTKPVYIIEWGIRRGGVVGSA